MPKFIYYIGSVVCVKKLAICHTLVPSCLVNRLQVLKKQVNRKYDKKHQLQDHGENPDREHVQKFVDDNFNPEGSEFETWDPEDWSETIPVFDKIKVCNDDSNLRS